MILTAPLRAGTLLANVRYRWIVGGIEGPEQTTGITQPSASFPLFCFNAVPPPFTEELMAYDVTDLTNWNVGGFDVAVAFYKLPILNPVTLTIPMIPGLTLANLGYIWIANGVAGSPVTTGITQPDINFPLYVVSVSPPVLAEELILYDTTNLAAWNVAGFMLAEIHAVFTVPPVQPPVHFRSVTFKSVLDSILRRLGFDPNGDAITHDTIQAVVEHINSRVRYAWRYWEWPQFELVEQRAFAQDWNISVQYKRVNLDGLQDVVYYTDGNYYQVLATAPSDPPVGDLPTDTIYWALFAPTDLYILLDQPGKTAIGEVIDMYKTDPRLQTTYWACPVHFHPTDREIRAFGSVPSTVFIRFRLRYSQFTAIPYISTQTYNQNDLVYDPVGGDCYKSVINTNMGNPVTDGVNWVKVLFPDIFSEYVKAGAFASALRESNMASANVDVQQRVLLSAQAEAEALEYLTAEITRLQLEGQFFRYPRFGRLRDRDYWETDYIKLATSGIN